MISAQLRKLTTVVNVMDGASKTCRVFFFEAFPLNLVFQGLHLDAVN